MAGNDQAGWRTIELATDDISDLEALYADLEGTPGIAVQAVSAPLEPGDQGGGVLDFLTAACSGGAITVLLQIIQTHIESHSPGFKIKIRHGKESLEITGDNLEKALPAVRAFIDGS